MIIPSSQPLLLCPEVPLDLTLHTGCPVFLRPLPFSNTTLSALVLIMGGFSLPVFPFPIPGLSLAWVELPACVHVWEARRVTGPSVACLGLKGRGRGLPARLGKLPVSLVCVVLVLSSQASDQPAPALLRCRH